jgi:hypothetical protein
MSFGAAMFEDFRASLHPDTAEARLRYYQTQLDGIVVADNLAAIDGAASPQYPSPHYQALGLFRAHVAFAKAQIRHRTAQDVSRKAD